MLTFARAVRATLLAEEDMASKKIDEMEVYLGLLRAKKTMIQIQVSEADEQLGMVKEALDSDGIAEVSQSDDEGDSVASSPPHSSDFVSLDLDSESKSDHQSTGTSDTSIEHGKFPAASTASVAAAHSASMAAVSLASNGAR